MVHAQEMVNAQALINAILEMEDVKLVWIIHIAAIQIQYVPPALILVVLALELVNVQDP